MNIIESDREDVAIIGFSGRFPGARKPADFWRNLRDGVESIEFFGDDELQSSTLDGPLPAGDPRVVKARGFLAQPEWFDAAFFGINPREAEIMDPQHRVMLECAWEALEHAGVNPESYAGSIGVFAGSSLNTYLLANVLPNPAAVRRAGGYQTMLASDKDFLPTRISYKLDLRGPSLNIQTACSTSLVAVCVACQNLLGYHCDLALAGGVSISFPQKRGMLHQEGSIVSPDGHCRAFDAAAAGTVSGDGAGLVVLKRLSEALADDDPICAVIRGCAINNDGARKAGFTAPGIHGQAEVIALAQAQAGVDPETITYIEAHGTGTPIGDPIEIAGLTRAFGRAVSPGACALGAVKTNIGHLDAAAGIAGLIKTVLAMQHRQLPPTLHFRNPNPKIDFAGGPFHVNDRLRDWSANGAPLRAGVSSFGIGGTNAHVVLEEAPVIVPSGPAQPWQLLVLSAKTSTALDAATTGLAQYLRENPDVNIADVAWTLQVGRQAFAHRRAIVVRDRTDALYTLGSPDSKCVSTGLAVEDNPPVVFMLPGQGAQHVNMGRGLYESEPVYRENLDRCAEILKSQLGFDIRPIIHPLPGYENEAARQLAPTAVTQPALFSVEYALAQWWLSRNVTPTAIFGHSLGENVAACLAGVFTLDDALGLVVARARLMQGLPPGAMLAVRLPKDDFAEFLEAPLALAAVNAPSMCVAAGPPEAIVSLEEKIGSRGIGFRRVSSSHAFHSPMMDPVLDAFINEVRRVERRPPKIPYISNVTGEWITAEQATDPAYWASHMRRPVRFADGLETLFREQQPVLLEVGPGQTLGPLARQHPAAAAAPAIVSSLRRRSAAGPGDVPAVLKAFGQLWLAGVKVDWRALHAGARRRRLPLPTYPFERRRYWIEPPAAVGDKHHRGNGQTQATAPLSATDAAAPTGAPATAGESGQSDTLVKLTTIFSELSGNELSKSDVNVPIQGLGFDSLLLTLASESLKKHFGVDISMRRLQEEFPTLEKLAAHLERTLSARPGETTTPERVTRSRPAETAQSVPLTETQREIWFAVQLGSAVSAAYNESCTVHLRGPIDIDRLRRAAQLLVDRHESLRTTFNPSGNLQFIAAAGRAELPLTELGSSGNGAAAERLTECIANLVRRPFDLERGPLWRMQLVRLGHDRHALVLVVHHIICDGWSLHLLVRELGEIYTALVRNETPALPPPGRFGAYARRQAEDPPAPQFAVAEAYWLKRFAEMPPPLDLPASRARPITRTYEGAHTRRTLSADATAGVRRLGAEHRCTVFTVLFAAFAGMLHRLTRQDDLVVGVPAATQALGGQGNLVGQFANLLPMRSRLRRNESFSEFLTRTRQTTLEAFDAWQYPFGHLLRKLNLSGQSNRVPLANVTFNYAALHGKAGFAGAEAAIAVNPKRFVNFDINFNVTEADRTFTLDCHYSAELFDPDLIERFLGQYETLLEAIGANPEQPVDALPVLTVAERRRLLTEWTDTRAEYPRNQCVHQLFTAMAEKTPEAAAVVFADTSISYRELNRQSDRLALNLRSAGVGPDVPVGICTERSPAMVVAVLGVLKAGGAYVPLDPAYPRERLALMLEDSQAPVLLTRQRFAGLFPSNRARMMFLEDPHLQPTDSPSATRPAEPSPDHLAYVIYTSGSTGVPKGVAMPHRPLVNLISWQLRNFATTPGARTLQFAPLSFDVSFQEIFSTLCAGGTLVLVDEDLRRDTQGLWRFIARERIERLFLPFAALRQLAEMFDPNDANRLSLREIITAGEQLCITPIIASLFETLGKCTLHNQYGPTETHVITAFTLAGPPRDWRPLPPIGRPIANTAVYLLDQNRQPVPIDVPGELYVGGDCLARGYLHHPDLTAKGFVPNPFSEESLASPGSGPSRPESRLYRTGDLARWRPDGNLEFLGRIDNQVKIRGYRVEPGEIEAVLARHPAVDNVAVVAREDLSGDRQLVAYITGKAGAAPDETEIRTHLKTRLPDYLVPAIFVYLEKLPLTPSGKVDRRTLPAPDRNRNGRPENNAAPRNATEEVLAKIWREVLELEPIDIHDNFFELGGHSLLATQVLSRVNQAFQVELPFRRFFENPTIEQLASVVEETLIAELSSLSDEEAKRLVEDNTNA